MGTTRWRKVQKTLNRGICIYCTVNYECEIHKKIKRNKVAPQDEEIKKAPNNYKV